MHQGSLSLTDSGSCGKDTPYRPHSLGDGSKCCHGKGFKTICIALTRTSDTFIWLPVSFVPPYRKQLIELNRMPFITHATKTLTMFVASVIANVLHLFDGFLHHLLRLLHRTQFRRRVSGRSVALAASCSSDSYISN